MENVKRRCIASERLCDTGFSYTLSLISGKYKMTILYTLMEFTIVRYNELQRYIKGISYKTLSLSLKELENDGLIIRRYRPRSSTVCQSAASRLCLYLTPCANGAIRTGGKNIIGRFV